MRICFFTPVSLQEGGGAEHWLIEVSTRLSKNHEIIIVGLNYATIQRISYYDIMLLFDNYGIKYYELPSVKLPRGFPLPHPLHTHLLLNIFNTCDVIYMIVPTVPVEIWIKLFRRALRRKLIAGFHGFLGSDTLLQKLYFPIFKNAIKVFDSYHVLNKLTYAWLRSTSDKKIFYIPNGVDTKTFQLCKDPSLSQLFNVLFTGRLTEDKGADILIDIIKFVNDKLQLKNIRFIITGSGPYEREIRALAQSYNNVIYLGFVDRQALPKVYMEANLYLLPSRTVVGSNIPGVSDVIIDGATGRLVKPGDIKSFAKVIKDYHLRWSRDPARYYEMNKAIRDYIVKNYDWSITIRQLELMLKSIVDQ
jgi:glycosyltransferase involved in cell wall biosynthesis